MIHGDMVDTRLPTNLRDDEFSEDVSALPHARSTLEFTPILVTIFGARQIKLLRRVIQQALAVETPSYGDVRLLDSELRSLHEDVPPSLRYRPVRESGFADVPVRENPNISSQEDQRCMVVVFLRHTYMVVTLEQAQMLIVKP